MSVSEDSHRTDNRRIASSGDLVSIIGAGNGTGHGMGPGESYVVRTVEVRQHVEPQQA